MVRFHQQGSRAGSYKSNHTEPPRTRPHYRNMWTCDGAHTTLGLEVSCHKVMSASDVEAGFVKFLRRKSTVKSKDVIVKHPVPALTRLGYQHFKLYPVTTSDGSDKSYSPFVMSSNAFFYLIFNEFDLKLFLSYYITLHPDCLLGMTTHNLQLSVVETFTEHIFTALWAQILKIYTICTSCLWQKYVSKTDHVKKV